MYYYYDSGELRGPFSIHELQSQVNGDELVRNESNHWQAAQDIEGWDEAVEEFVPLESEEPIETMAISTENLIENESTEIPEVGGIRIEADEPDEFNYEKPSKFWRYFSYNDEYITGGTYIGRLILQSMTIPLLGLGFYLIIITVYKRARSLGMDGGAGIVAGITGVNLIGNYVNGFNAQPTYNSYYSSEPEMSGPALFLSVLSFFLTLVVNTQELKGGYAGWSKSSIKKIRYSFAISSRRPDSSIEFGNYISREVWNPSRNDGCASPNSRRASGGISGLFWVDLLLPSLQRFYQILWVARGL